MTTHERTINVALGEILAGLRRSWTVHTEEIDGLLDDGGRVDILVQDASGWPVAIEAERENHAAAESDAIARLGRTVARTDKTIETAIALVHSEALLSLTGDKLRETTSATDAFEYALYSRRPDRAPERLPAAGWLRGDLRDLAMLIRRAAAPAARVDELAQELERGVEQAANLLTERHPIQSPRGRQFAELLRQEDDEQGQTRRIGMTVLANALIFHAALADANFVVPTREGPRPLLPVERFHDDISWFQGELSAEWTAVLRSNYWPIFATARELLRLMPQRAGTLVLERLWRSVRRLIDGGVTRSHDLMGVVFQRLIADRKFLATFYTRPTSAALLTGLAVPAGRAPRGADWSDAEALGAIQIGDFACGTGTLLSSAYQRIAALHELHGGDPTALHQNLMANGLVGLDVVNTAVHLTASMLAGVQPGTPFDGECLLTMTYGAQNDGSVRAGSLELLADSVQPNLVADAAATTAGGREPENVQDLVSRVGHGQFDLVIMNPPFTRPTNQELAKRDVPIPAYAAFEASAGEQRKLGNRISKLTKDGPSNGFAGLASHFAELADRKLRPDGALAMVLPLSAISGESWSEIRSRWADQSKEIIVVTIAQPKEIDTSFSADTNIAECLLIAARGQAAPRRGYFVVLQRRPESAQHGDLIADAIRRQIGAGAVRRLEDGPIGGTPLTLANEVVGQMLDCPLTDGPWGFVGVADSMLAQIAHAVSNGALPAISGGGDAVQLPVDALGAIGRSGPVHRAVGSLRETRARGAFEIHKPPLSPQPAFPALWTHDETRKARRTQRPICRDRSLIVQPDSEGFPRDGADYRSIWPTATRAHYNSDIHFNAQSLLVAMTPAPALGGRAWPSVILNDPEHEPAFALWSNSTLGLLMHWWVGNKTQGGRGSVTVTTIPKIPTLNLNALTPAQHAAAHKAFEALSERRFLPFAQLDDDPARAELDRALLVDVLGLDPSVAAEGGPIDLIRRKLAAEPQIHGGKQTRVMFDGDWELDQPRAAP